jgi:hypothetical protein
VSRLLTCAAVLALAAAVTGLAAQPAITPPSPHASLPKPLEDIYQDGQSVRFLHHSGVVGFADRYSLQYAVCNLGLKDDLYFRWAKPEIGTGWKHPVPLGRCASFGVDTDSYRADFDAPIIFGFQNAQKKAAAYLPQASAPVPANAFIRTFFTREGVPNIVEFSLRLALRPDKTVVGVLEWSQGIGRVGLGNIPEAIHNQIIADLERGGVKVRPVAARELVPAEFDQLGERAREARYLSIEGEGGAVRAIFTYPAAGESIIAPVVVLDQAGLVLATSVYRLIR